ncbi:flavin reductase family protein [Arthrobacter sp. MI7-26]|uniref:flavin reductase family protein n=1 Tax=Arthrobacter sp. MI7-26 TaxID=2993653 RepID=UPI00224921C3|nr:flavin reductase family protein [Arthrobacter sp. MI7-26]MCX2750003.1 flavin reductase family protein [Arthrobacter sp. MI7-26]
MTIVTGQLGTIDPAHVRNVMAVVPTSVTVIAGQPELTGEHSAMIVGSFVFISLEPCFVGFFVGHESTSWPQLNKATVLGISTLGSVQTDICRKLGKKEADRFADGLWRRGAFGAPLVTGSVATMECQIENVTKIGDHDFVLARVLGLNTGSATNPLIFQNHEFSGLLPG